MQLTNQQMTWLLYTHILPCMKMLYRLKNYLKSSRTGLAGIILYACSERVVTNGVYITLPVSTHSCTLCMEKEIKEDWFVEQKLLLLDLLSLQLIVVCCVIVCLLLVVVIDAAVSIKA